MSIQTLKPPAFGRMRCHWCSRVLTNREFIAGLARVTDMPTYQGYRETPEHTYNCEKEPRRKVAP